MVEADGILLGSPTYFADVSAGMKALIERCGMVSRANGDMFRRKAGAGVVAVRRAGAYHVFSSLNAFFLIGQMIIPGSSYWNLAHGRPPGEVANDEERDEDHEGSRQEHGVADETAEEIGLTQTYGKTRTGCQEASRFYFCYS
jgi:multimeric flavodoxin WrbA